VKTLVGVDSQNIFSPALDLLSDLRFDNNELILAHVDAFLVDLPVEASVPVGYVVTDVQREILQGTHLMLTKAGARAAAAGFPGASEVHATGTASQTLITLADERNVDLVAIGSRKHGALECFFLGSVGRALAISGRQSFLIARGVKKTRGPVHAVFATDHSAYANRCFDHFLKMAPRGLSQVSICTARESAIDDSLAEEVGRDDRSMYSITNSEDQMMAHGEEMASSLRSMGIAAHFQLLNGHPSEALPFLMTQAQADMMILGSRGHGLIERFFIGSLALYLVVSEQFPVLVLRVPEAA
jgi:nucleotide-binding universal stress UspA family protein